MKEEVISVNEYDDDDDDDDDGGGGYNNTVKIGDATVAHPSLTVDNSFSYNTVKIGDTTVAHPSLTVDNSFSYSICDVVPHIHFHIPCSTICPSFDRMRHDT